MNNSDVTLVLRAETKEFSEKINQAESDFRSRFKDMGRTASEQSNRINSNFKNISSGTSQFTSELKKAAKQLTIVAGAVTGIGAIGHHMLHVGDQIVKTSDKIGITTDLLQELRFAASQTGLSSDKLELSLERFVKRIGEAARGSSSATAPFQRLGVSVLEADGTLRDTGSILHDVADGLAGMSSQAERAAAITSIFGRKGLAMSLMLGKGAAHLEAFQEEARHFGIVIDEELLRHSEEAADKLDLLFSILKAQAVTAFAQFAPQVISFTQNLAAAAPKVKDFLSVIFEMKDAFLMLMKAIVVGKLISFTANLLSAGKAFVIASGMATKFGQAILLVGKSFKAFGLNAAIFATVEAISLFKKHFDIYKNAKNYIQAQENVIKSHMQYANSLKLSEENFKQLSFEEQKSYQDRLRGAQQFWQAKLKLEANKDSQSAESINAAKENRLFSENMTMVEGLLSKRVELENKHFEQLNQIREEESNLLKRSLSSELKDYDDANQNLKGLQEKRKTIAKEFKALVDEIQSPQPKKPEQYSVLDITSAQQAARSALGVGNIDQAMNAINQVKEVIRSLSQTGEVTKAYLTDQAKATAQIAEQVVQSEIEAQEANVASIKDKITEIKAQAELLKHLSVEFDTDGAVKSADEMRSILQDRLASNPLIIPTVVIPETQGIDSRAEQILKPQKKARGGFIIGPGTSMSDSILARLSRGEFVLRASAVQHYGLSVLNRLNQKQLPKFANGGLVPPMVPALRTRNHTSSQVASLTLNLGSENFNVTTRDIDVVQALTKAISREALKSGRKF